ncbi:MAG: SDR family oxidoreductase [Nitrospirae bacterium]|nr:SDR family oxidoreductase [Nitrospirota bacterium]
MKINKQKKVLLTGATGLIGSYLLKLLLQKGLKVYVLARDKNGRDAGDRVREILKFWDKDILPKHPEHIHGAKELRNVIPAKAGIQRRELDSRFHGKPWIPCQARNDKGGVFLGQKAHNLVVLNGDITQKDLGLSRHDIKVLISETDEIFHSAAVTQFNRPLEQVRRVNSEGTRNILELAVLCKAKGRLGKVNHISTAYVCGDYEGVFKEDDLEVGQKFNNTYTQTKFEAEKLVEKYRKKGLRIDIFRPPLVIGEASSGKTITFQQSIYQLLHIWNLELFTYFPGKDLELNVAFVDDLCKAIFKISSSTSATNKTYHLFNYKTVSLKTVLDGSSKFLGFKKPDMVSRDDFFKKNPSPAQKLLLANNILLINNNVRLNSKRTNKILARYGFKFSDLNRDSFRKLLEYCVREGFLRKR